jgi:hypothetical protein
MLRNWVRQKSICSVLRNSHFKRLSFGHSTDILLTDNNTALKFKLIYAFMNMCKGVDTISITSIGENFRISVRLLKPVSGKLKSSCKCTKPMALICTSTLFTFTSDKQSDHYYQWVFVCLKPQFPPWHLLWLCRLLWLLSPLKTSPLQSSIGRRIPTRQVCLIFSFTPSIIIEQITFKIKCYVIL